MRPDIHVVVRDTRAEIHLRKNQRGEDHFTVMTRALGLESDTARAAFVGVDPRTINRVRNGVIGEDFMSKTVAALRRYESVLAEYGLHPSLDNLFVVLDVPVDARSVAEVA